MSGARRRSSYAPQPLAYAAVGASRYPDLMRFPPEGASPFSEQLKVGSGPARFATASEQLMSLAVLGTAAEQVEVRRAEESGQGASEEAWAADVAATGSSLPADSALAHSEDSDFVIAATPEGEAAPEGTGTAGLLDELVFSSTGEPYAMPGDEVTLTVAGRQRAMLVTHRELQPELVQLTLGHCDDGGAVGEITLSVTLTGGEVLAGATGFMHPSRSGFLGLRAKAELAEELAWVREVLTALAPHSENYVGQVEPQVVGVPAGAQGEEAAEELDAGAEAELVVEVEAEAEAEVEVEDAETVEEAEVAETVVAETVVAETEAEQQAGSAPTTSAAPAKAT